MGIFFIELLPPRLQAHVLEERNKRAALQTDVEDAERQLKRSLAKVTALGRDREDREAKLREKQVFPLF